MLTWLASAQQGGLNEADRSDRHARDRKLLRSEALTDSDGHQSSKKVVGLRPARTVRFRGGFGRADRDDLRSSGSRGSYQVPRRVRIHHVVELRM